MTDQQLLDVLPNGVLKDYVNYWRPTTDAPSIYLVSGALITTASLMRSRVFVSFGGQPLHPNLWILLLGPSSLFRKTTCINKARSTIANLSPELLMPEEFSREALVRHLSAQPSGLVTASEFSGTLATLSRDYMAGTKELLADLYDAPPTYSRIVGKERLEVVQPCLSLFAASQTGWFLEKVKEIDLQSGFLARFIYMPAFNKPPSIAIPPDPDSALGDVLHARLRDLTLVEGRLALSPKVVGQYARWMEDHENELLKQDEQIERLSPFWTRLTATTLKLAMILQVSSDGRLELTEDTLERAIKLTTLFKDNLRQLFLNEFTFTRDMAHKKKVLRLIEKNGEKGIDRRDLMRNSNLLKKDFDPVLQTLIEEGSVYSDAGGTNGSATRVRYFVSPSRLASAA